MAQRDGQFSKKTVTVIVACVAASIVLAEGGVVAKSGRVYSLDVRSFLPRGDPLLRESPGVLASGGYCSFGARLEKLTIRAAEDDSSEVTVEIVRHPPEYPFAVHDLIGTLRAAVQWSAHQNSPHRPAEEHIHVEELGWTLTGTDTRQVIGFGAAGPGAASGIVGWHTGAPAVHEVITVCIRFERLQGLPQQIINRMLTEHPSSLATRELERDWVDDDLQKCIHILRTAPADSRIPSVLVDRLARYQTDAAQDWDVQSLVGTERDDERRKAQREEIAAKVDQWRASRKATPAGP